MAEQSSTVATLRALVMLLCVILIPVAAICGTSFPNVVKAIQSGRLPTAADFRTNVANASTAGARSDAPAYREPAMPMGGQANAARPGGYAPAYTPPTGAAASPVMQLSYNAPVTNGAAANGIASTDSRSTSFPQDGASRYAEKSAEREPQRLPSPGPTTQFTIPGTPGAAASGAALTPDAQFKQIQDRLRQMGAKYYLLEAWGQNHQYRFYSEMAIGGDSHFTKSFQCIDNDPLQAMKKVLDDVEAWQKHGS